MHEDENDGVPKEKKQHRDPKTIGLGESPKPKKKRKAKSKRGLVSSPNSLLFIFNCESGLMNGKAAPNGFEEYYVDVPILPAEYEEERGIYHEYVLE